MTLNTNFYVTTPGIDPAKIWDALLDQVEPKDFPISREDYTESEHITEKGWGPKGAICTNSRCGVGLSAWCFMYHNEDGSEIFRSPEEVDDPSLVDWDKDLHYSPRSYIRLAFDTAYGYHGPHGEVCSTLHARIVSFLAGFVTAHGGEYAWQNEFTGEWFTSLDGIPEFVGS